MMIFFNLAIRLPVVGERGVSVFSVVILMKRAAAHVSASNVYGKFFF